jgi:hypothetical protein
VLALGVFLALLAFPRRAVAAEPQRTTIGIYVVQVGSIDLKNNNFAVDFWIWFRGPHRDTSPIDSFEIVDGRVHSKGPVVKKQLEGGLDYAAVRISATIHRQWDLHRYPFDDHDLEIAIEDSDLDVGRSVFIPDHQSQGMDPAVVVAGWDLVGFEHEVGVHRYPSNYGDTSIATAAEASYSRYVVRMHARRTGAARFLKVAFPLFVAVLAAWCAFFIRPKDSGPRVAVSVGALFAAAAATVAINSQLPDISYATVSDRTVFLSFGMIAWSLLATVAALSFHYGGKEVTHRRIDAMGAATFPVVFALLLIFLVRT